MSSIAPQSKEFKVAIVGGGICGLAAAVGLMKGGIDVEIYEAAVNSLERLTLQNGLTDTDW